jgi:hypothetical protein
MIAGPIADFGRGSLMRLTISNPPKQTQNIPDAVFIRQFYLIYFLIYVAEPQFAIKKWYSKLCLYEIDEGDISFVHFVPDLSLLAPEKDLASKEHKQNTNLRIKYRREVGVISTKKNLLRFSVLRNELKQTRIIFQDPSSPLI